MKSFDQWFAEQKAEPQEPDLPDGVWVNADGKYCAWCCVCGNEYELFHDPIAEGFDQDMSYCGSGPSCCP
jgi:hypothetical protein